MGGTGSGGWYRFDKKATVEESLALGMKDLRKRLFVGAAGTLTWTWTGGRTSSIGYFVTGSDDLPAITLHYRWRDEQDVRISISLESMPMQFGGSRRWFICPLIVRGTHCNRRASKLYLPPGARYFGCRKCHNLTYRSCQEAHKTERMFAQLGFDPGAARLWEQMRRRK